MSGAVRTLLFSSLYPSSARPLHGIFVETRLRELLATGRVMTKVVAPVPWFPSANPRLGRYADLAATPRRELHNGIDVRHPRYMRLPKLGMSLAPLTMALGAHGTVAELIAEGFDFDVIDAHYFYPDGVAAAMLASWFGKPLAITARGTDVNLIPDYLVPRQLIRWAARRAQASIGVSAALAERLRTLGTRAERLHVMRNGVDLQRFHPTPRAAARAALGLQGQPLLLTVGNLHEHKGQRLVVQALARLRGRWPQARLVIVGDGPDRVALAELARGEGVADAVTLAGAVPNAELACWYSAADVMILASSREGWPNVLLESMASGTPVVASRVGGVPEIVQAPVAGRVVGERTPQAFAAAIDELLAAAAEPSQVRRFAESFSWERTSQAQLELFRAMAART